MDTVADPERALDDALLRAGYHRFLAEAFRYPKAGTLERLREFLPAPETAGLWSSEAVAPALAGVARILAGLSAESLEQIHLGTYGHTIPPAWPPLETRYGSSHAFQESQDLADVTAFYSAHGLRPRPDAGERPDHAASELEFAYFLALKEADARERGDLEGAERSLGSSRLFLEAHLGRWTPTFGGILAKNSPRDWTRALGALLEAVVDADVRLLGVDPRPVCPQPIPIPPEPDADAGDDAAE